MGRTISAAELFEEVEVDLALRGQDPLLYRLQELTKGVSVALGKAEDAWGALTDDASNDQTAKKLIDVIDAMLEPKAQNGSGKLETAKVLLNRQYAAGEIGFDKLSALHRALAAEFEKRMPGPPSPPANDG